MSDWYLWCPACDAYWTLPDKTGFPVPYSDKRCPRCGSELLAGTAIYNRPTAPLPKVPHLGAIVGD